MVAKHQGFCLKTIKESKTSPTEISIIENFDFGSALENVYPLLDIVFSYLNCDELRTCSQVNSSWKDIAINHLEKRIEPSWFTCFKRGTSSSRTTSKCVYSIQKSGNLKHNCVSVGIILIDSRTIRSNKKVCVHTEEDIFSSTSITQYIEKELIPKDVKYCVLSCCRVLSSFQPEINLVDKFAMEGLFLPQIPNISTAMFYYDGNDDPNFQNMVEQNQELKCLLIFTTTRKSSTNRKKIIDDLLTKLVQNNNETVALAGGVLRAVSSPQIFRKKNADVFSIAFWQASDSEADFNAFSCVINGEYLSKVEFTSEVSKFRKRIFLRRHCVAIRICCSAKKNAEEEIVIFSEIFEKVPLLGFYADGEIGWNSSLLKNNSIQQYQNVHHQWSTVFIVMTWGPII
ncbi:unnamed protein product [Phaedon cochleariae]|uniref:F-box domain-containing protein n=1 Tax=Phaedon cochleariae TaxID=80249 RepID=A0A9P0GMI7_PHACE|nr:unnamed protein product [Phaedon cochleariae]